MEKDKKYVRRSYLVHEYEKEEVFLSKMAREGWHFVNLHKGIPTKYEFIKGDPLDYIYRLDYVTTEEDTPDYHQLFLDSGWEEVFTWNGVNHAMWYYFRRLRTDGKDTMIFTDLESKYQMYDKLWKRYSLSLIIALFLELNGARVLADLLTRVDIPTTIGILLAILCSLLSFFTLMIGYMLVGIIAKRNKLKREILEHL